MSDLELGVVGNCAFSALINRRGRVVWCCLPRFDGDPLFCSLINGDGKSDSDDSDTADGFFDVLIDDFAYSEQHYEPTPPSCSPPCTTSTAPPWKSPTSRPASSAMTGCTVPSA
ncbi:hypothetical protein [Methylomagnum sp.]